MNDASTELDDIPVLSLNLTDVEQLYRAYMPFVDEGGLFVATNHPFALGDPVFVSLRLLNEPDPFRLKTNVIWVMSQTSGTTQRGVGILLVGEEGLAIKHKIETALAGKLKSDKPTDTI